MYVRSNSLFVVERIFNCRKFSLHVCMLTKREKKVLWNTDRKVVVKKQLNRNTVGARR